MTMAAKKNLCLRQAKWVSDYCLVEWEPWKNSVASAKKRSDAEREELIYLYFRLCVASSLTHQSFLNGVNLLRADQFRTGEKGMLMHLEFCSTNFRLWLLLPCRCCLHSFVLMHDVHMRWVSFTFHVLSYFLTIFWL